MNGYGGGGFGASGGGGGAYNTQAPAGFSQVASSQDGGQRQRVDTQQSMVNCTVKQLASTPPAADPQKLEVDGRELSQVQLVGQIRSVNKQSTNTQYMIDDSTGVIEVKRWGGDPNENFQQNQYVRVVGRVNIFQGKRSINAFKVFPITDFNEVTCHFLQVIEAHIYATKGGQPAQAGGQMQTNFNQQSVAAPAPAQQQMGGMQMGGQMNTAAMPMGEVGDGEGMSPEHNQLLAAIKELDSAGTEEGVHIEQVIKRLDPSGARSNHIKEMINFLAEEGHLYSTTDEEHFKATD